MALRDVEKNILAVYDIASHKRLRLVARIAESYGLRVQKSVFEMHIKPSILARMHCMVNSVIDHGKDSVRYYLLCEEDWQKRLIFGRTTPVGENWKDNFILL